MRIVQLEDSFFPNAGYQINIISKYFARHGNEVYILTAEVEKLPDFLTSFFGKDNIAERDARYTSQYNVNIIRIPIRWYYSGRAFFSNKIFQEVKRLNPDVVFVHGCQMLTAMRYLWKLRWLPYPLIMDCHMLEMASRNRLKIPFELFYKLFCASIIKKKHITVVRTQDDNYTEKCLGIPVSQTPWISFGSDTMIFFKDDEMHCKNREEIGIPEDAIVFLYAGKLDETKGGLFLADSIIDKFGTKKRVIFLIIGNTSGEYGNQVEAAFGESENEIIRIPTQEYDKLAYYYQLADVALFPRQCSLSFYDVQACGLPVIFEDNKINSDRAEHNNAFTFRQGDKKDFRKVIKKVIECSAAEMRQLSENAITFIKKDYDYEKISLEYLRLMEDAIQRTCQ